MSQWQWGSGAMDFGTPKLAAPAGDETTRLSPVVVGDAGTGIRLRLGGTLKVGKRQAST